MLLFQSRLQLPISVCNDAFLPSFQRIDPHLPPTSITIISFMYTTRIRTIIFLPICPHFTRPASSAGLSTIICLGTVVTTKCVTVKTKEFVL